MGSLEGNLRPKNNVPGNVAGAMGAFVRYLKDDRQRYAFQVVGSWGSGKTHLYEKHLVPQCEALGFRTAYVSVAGIKTFDQLEQAILYATYPLLTTKTARFTGGLLKGAIRFAKLDIDELIKLEAKIDSKTCVCIDDLERIDSSCLPSAFGKISELLERNRARVLILCDETKLLANSDYLVGKEKVVSRSYSFRPGAEETVDIAFAEYAKELDDLAARTDCGVEDLRSAAIEATETATRISARTSLAAVACFLELVEQISIETCNFPLALPRLLRTTFVVWSELAENAGRRPIIQRVFALGLDDISLYMSPSPDGDAREFASKRLDSVRYPPVKSLQMLRFIAESTCDFGTLQREIHELLAPLSRGMDAEEIVEQYRRASQKEFESALGIVVSKLEGGAYGSLQQIARLAAILFHLQARSLISMSASDLADLLISAAKTATARILASPDPNAPLDEIFIGQPISELHSRVIDNLKLFSQRVGQTNFEKTKRKLFERITSDPKSFAADLVNNRESYSRAALFVKIEDADEVAARLEGLFSSSPSDTEALYAVAKAFKRRYAPEDMTQVAVAERLGLDELTRRLENHRETMDGSHTLARAAIQELIDAIAVPTAS